MKVLITGGFGFIGSHLVKALRDQRDIVTVLDWTNAGNSSYTSSDMNTVQMDVRDLHGLTKYLLQNPHDAVVHLAAVTGIALCMERPKETFEVNLYGTYNVATACRESGARLIFASSREVYGSTEGRLSYEEDQLTPNNLYGLSKMLGENTIRWMCEQLGLNFTILRFTNVYGPGGDKYNVQAMARRALSEGLIEVYGGTQILNLLHVDDALKAIITCLRNSDSCRETFNVCGPSEVSVAELAERVRDILDRLGRNITVLRRPPRPGDTEFNRPNMDKIRNRLGWKPRVGLEEGLALTIRYYLEKNRIAEYPRP